MAAKKLKTTIAVIDYLGGDKAVGAMLGADHKAVYNWRRFKFFPANTYIALQQALKHYNKTAPDRLWAMKQLKDFPPR